MALSPQRIRDTQFKSARRGYDPEEVNSFVQEVAVALESAQNEATAMEARARAAVARLQELSQAPGADATATIVASPADADGRPPSPPSDGLEIRAHPEESETISRTLLLAQRTADTTVAEAQAEADRVMATARDEAESRLDGARQEAVRLVEEAKADARRAGEGERVTVEGEVQALMARRDFLESDVDHLESHLTAQRERITEAVSELHALVERVPSGLGEMRRPLLSAAHDDSDIGSGGADGDRADDELDDTLDHERSEISEITRVAATSADDDHALAPPSRAGERAGPAAEAGR